jgi:hypothetical protein
VPETIEATRSPIEISCELYVQRGLSFSTKHLYARALAILFMMLGHRYVIFSVVITWQRNSIARRTYVKSRANDVCKIDPLHSEHDRMYTCSGAVSGICCLMVCGLTSVASISNGNGICRSPVVIVTLTLGNSGKTLRMDGFTAELQGRYTIWIGHCVKECPIPVESTEFEFEASRPWAVLTFVENGVRHETVLGTFTGI